MGNIWLFLLGTGVSVLGVWFAIIDPLKDYIKMRGKSDSIAMADRFINNKINDYRKYTKRIIIGGIITTCGIIIMTIDYLATQH